MASEQHSNGKSSSAATVILLLLAMAALIAAKVLWALSGWYEWIALGVAAALLFLHQTGRQPSSTDSPEEDHDAI